MAIYGTITAEMRKQFRSKFYTYFSLNPTGTEWIPIGEILSYVYDREEFRNSFNWSHMVNMLREMCESAGLTREDRIIGEGHVDQTEGYFGFERK